MFFYIFVVRRRSSNILLYSIAISSTTMLPTIILSRAICFLCSIALYNTLRSYNIHVVDCNSIFTLGGCHVNGLFSCDFPSEPRKSLYFAPPFP